MRLTPNWRCRISSRGRRLWSYLCAGLSPTGWIGLRSSPLFPSGAVSVPRSQRRGEDRAITLEDAGPPSGKRIETASRRLEWGRRSLGPGSRANALRVLPGPARTEVIALRVLRGAARHEGIAGPRRAVAPGPKVLCRSAERTEQPLGGLLRVENESRQPLAGWSGGVDRANQGRGSSRFAFCLVRRELRSSRFARCGKTRGDREASLSRRWQGVRAADKGFRIPGSATDHKQCR